MGSTAAIGSSKVPHDFNNRTSTWRTSFIGFFRQRRTRSKTEVRKARETMRLTISRPIPAANGDVCFGDYVPLFMAADMVMVGHAMEAKQSELERQLGLVWEQEEGKSTGYVKADIRGKEYRKDDSTEALDTSRDQGPHPLRQNAMYNADDQGHDPDPASLSESESESEQLGTWRSDSSLDRSEQREPSSPTTISSPAASSTSLAIPSSPASATWNSISTFQSHLFRLPLELRHQIYDLVLDITSIPDFSNQEPLKYNISPGLGYPGLENFSSISVNMSRSWKVEGFGCSHGTEVEGEGGEMMNEIKRRFCEKTTFVISMSASFPSEWYDPDLNGRYEFLDEKREMQILYLLSDPALKPWLPFIRNVKLILLLSTTDGFAGGSRENGEEEKHTPRYAAVAKIGWIMQHCVALKRLDVSVTLSECRPCTEEWVWSLLEPLKRIRGCRRVTVNGLTLLKESASGWKGKGKEKDEEEREERGPEGQCDCNGWARYRPATPLKWERTGDDEVEGEDDAPSERFEMFEKHGRYSERLAQRPNSIDDEIFGFDDDMITEVVD